MSNQQSRISNREAIRFSIITPSFNQLDWLRLCVASVRDQLEPTPIANQPPTAATEALLVEHIVQDGGTPGIEEFAREAGASFYREEEAASPRDNSKFKTQNPKLPESFSLKILSERDSGMYDAINRGLRRSTGEICAYLNCDEQYLPGALEAVASHFADNPETDILFADAVVADGTGNYICHRKAQTPFRDQLWFRMPILTCATFFRRRVFETCDVWFDETKKVCGDVIWLMRAQNAGLGMRVLRRFTSVFTDTGEALGLGTKADEEFLELQRNMPGRVRRFLPAYLAYHRFRTLCSGVHIQRPFEFGLYTLASPARRVTMAALHPTQVWRNRLDVDRKALARTGGS